MFPSVDQATIKAALIGSNNDVDLATTQLMSMNISVCENL